MKYTLLVLIASLGLIGCGTETDVVTVKGEKGDAGAAGLSGSQGQSGANGHSIVSQANNNPSFCGSVGGTEVKLALDMNDNLLFDSSDVVQSQFFSCNGQRGATGAAGTSCTVTKSGSVSTIKCGSATVSVNDGANGANGTNGTNGTNGVSPTIPGLYISEIVNPCGEGFANDEIFIRLSNGRLIALYDGGANLDRLTLVAPGNYITTDSNNRYCSFTITSDYKLINERVN